MDETTRREPAFEAESEAYSLFQRGVGFLRERHPAQAAMLLAHALRLEPGRNSIREALGRAEFALGMHGQAAERFRDVVAESPLDVALLATDQLSGLITAAALVRPDKDLAGVSVKSLRKRFRESAFARGVDRDAIVRCAELGLELDAFMGLGLAAMQGIAPQLGL